MRYRKRSVAWNGLNTGLNGELIIFCETYSLAVVQENQIPVN